MKSFLRNIKSNILLLIIIILGFIYRYQGIVKQLSFWNDEINAALMGRGILWYGKPVTPYGSGWGLYQLGLHFITATSFKIFGINEWSGRLPSVIVGTLLIITIYIIANKILGKRQALISSFICSFSQIQLAWSTQLRPYIWLELFTLLNIYFLYKYLSENKKIFDRNLLLACGISVISTFFHGTGLINILIISIVGVIKIIKQRKYQYLFLLPIFGIFSLFILFNSFGQGWGFVYSSLFNFYFSPLHYRIFLTHNYLWLLVGSLLGGVILYSKKRSLSLLLTGSIGLIFLVAIFKVNPRYVRYSLPAFPLMYLLFAQGIEFVFKKIAKKKYLHLLLYLLVLFVMANSKKIVLLPSYYYSINADVRENPIVDYKFAFKKINDLIADKDNSVIVDAWDERVPWFMPKQKFVLASRLADVKIDPYYGEPVINSPEELQKVTQVYSVGIAIVEDWESIMPEDIKKYIRDNLKKEFTVQDIPYNDNDHWGISVYSWGI